MFFGGPFTFTPNSLEIRAKDWNYRIELNLDLSFHLSIVRKINGPPPCLSEPIKWNGAPMSSRTAVADKQQQRNSAVRIK